jgi:DNA repair protein RadC
MKMKEFTVKDVGLPAAFVVCEPNTFTVRDKVTVDEVLTAAKAIITQQCKKKTATALTSAELAKQLAILQLATAKVECFCVMFLDNKHKLINFETMAKGTINQAHVYPREIAKRAFELNAAAIILVHNHPSGNCAPSKADEWLTTSIKSAFKLLSIDVIDHLIVAGDQAYSFADHGKL